MAKDIKTTYEEIYLIFLYHLLIAIQFYHPPTGFDFLIACLSFQTVICIEFPIHTDSPYLRIRLLKM